MCYAIPGKIISINDKIAEVDYFREKRKVLLDLPDLKIGDYIIAQGGIIVKRIPEEEAQKTLEDWEEAFKKFKEKDNELAEDSNTELDLDPDLNVQFLEIIQKVNKGKELTNEELTFLLNIKEKKELSILFEQANLLRQRKHGNASCVHGIIEFSNYCKGNCKYCGIRRDRKIQRYRLSKQEIINHAKYCAEVLGFTALVLQSGEDDSYSIEELEEIVREVRALGVLVFLSIGLRTKLDYQRLYDAGARAVLLRFETSDPEIFSNMRPGTTLDERLQRIREIKQIGYILATGFIFGLPGETQETIINNLKLTKELEPDMYSFGPLIPTKETPLENEIISIKDEALKIIALQRILSPEVNILVTTAFETLDKDTKQEGLLAGGNSLMINLTPKNYQKLYAIYDGKNKNDQEINKEIQLTIDLLEKLGRVPMDIGLTSYYKEKHEK
jgi:biotin synthase